MAKLREFLKNHPKPAFSEKVQRGDQGKFFKNHPKSSPRLKLPKSSLAKMALSSNMYALIVKKTGEDFNRNSGSKSARMAK